MILCMYSEQSTHLQIWSLRTACPVRYLIASFHFHPKWKSYPFPAFLYPIFLFLPTWVTLCFMQVRNLKVTFHASFFSPTISSLLPKLVNKSTSNSAILLYHHHSLYYVNLFLDGTGNWTQDFTHASSAVYHWATSPPLSPFLETGPH